MDCHTRRHYDVDDLGVSWSIRSCLVMFSAITSMVCQATVM